MLPVKYGCCPVGGCHAEGGVFQPPEAAPFTARFCANMVREQERLRMTIPRAWVYLLGSSLAVSSWLVQLGFEG